MFDDRNTSKSSDLLINITYNYSTINFYRLLFYAVVKYLGIQILNSYTYIIMEISMEDLSNVSEIPAIINNIILHFSHLMMMTKKY